MQFIKLFALVFFLIKLNVSIKFELSGLKLYAHITGNEVFRPFICRKLK